MTSLLQKKMVSLNNLLRYQKNRLLCYIDRRFGKPLMIMNEKETIDYIVDNHCSVSRFGDGELQMVTYGRDIGFQKSSDEIRIRLKEVAQSRQDNLLVCFSNRLKVTTEEEFSNLPPYWKYLLDNNLHDWLRWIPKNKIYGDANISRLTGTALFGTKRAQVDYTKRIWQNRHVILVEGNETRFGVGNDLLNNARSVKRVLGPARSAYDLYDTILEAALLEAKKTENPIILLALGPAATIMAYDLCREGYQAVDIGHLDICYEIELRELADGTAVPGKYTNEAKDGTDVSACLDEDYLSQIVFSATKNES